MTGLANLRSATIYRRKQDGRAQGRWKLEVRYEGRRPQISSWDTRREAQQELARLKALAKTVVVGGPEQPFAEYARRWMAVQEQLGLADSTIERKRSTITTWLVPEHGRWGFADRRTGTVRAEGALELFAEMRRQGRSERTGHKVYEVLNQILTTAVRDHLIPTNPLEKLLRGERPRATRQRSPKIMTHRQVWEVFHEIRRRRGTAFPDYSLLWLTAYYQGHPRRRGHRAHSRRLRLRPQRVLQGQLQATAPHRPACTPHRPRGRTSPTSRSHRAFCDNRCGVRRWSPWAWTS